VNYASNNYYVEHELYQYSGFMMNAKPHG